MAQQSDPKPIDAAPQQQQQQQQHVVPIQPSERASSSEVAKTRRFDSIANQLSAGPRGLPRETAQGITDIARRMVEDRTIMDRLRNICKDVVVDQSPQRVVVDQTPNKVEELASPISSPTADTKTQQQEQRHHFEQGHFPKPDSSNSTSSFVRVASPEPHSPKQMPSKHQHQRQPPHHNISSQQEISSLLTDDEFFEIFASDPFVRIPENETPSRCADVSAAATAAPTEDHEPLTEDRLHRAAAEASGGKHPLPDTTTLTMVATAPPTQPPTNPPTNPPRTEPGDLGEGLEEEEEDMGLASLPADDDATTPSPRRVTATPPLTQEEQDEVAVHRDWPSLPSLPLAPTTALGDEGRNMTDDTESATKKTSSTSPMMSTVVRSLWTTIWGGFGGGAPEDEGDGGGISSNARSPNQTNDGEEEDEERPPQGPLMTPRRPMRRPAHPEQDEEDQPYEYDAFGKRRAKRRPHHSRQASRDDGCFGDMGLGRGITAALHQHHAVDDHEEEYRFYHRQQHPAEESSSSTSLPPSSSSLHHHHHTLPDPGHRGAGTAQLDEQHQPNFIHDERFYLAAAMLINSSLVYAMIASSGGASPSPQGSPPRAVVVQKVLERVVEAVQAAFLR